MNKLSLSMGQERYGSVHNDDGKDPSFESMKGKKYKYLGATVEVAEGVSGATVMVTLVSGRCSGFDSFRKVGSLFPVRKRDLKPL